MNPEPTGLKGDDLGTPYLRFEREGPLAWCVVDRPEARNALTSAMYFGVRRAVDLLNKDPELAALIITGTGDMFMPGGELRGRSPTAGSTSPTCWASTPPRSRRSGAPPKPVVSAVNGVARAQACSSRCSRTSRWR